MTQNDCDGIGVRMYVIGTPRSLNAGRKPLETGFVIYYTQKSAYAVLLSMSVQV